MNDPLRIIETCQRVIDSARFVSIDEGRLNELAAAVRKNFVKGISLNDLGLKQDYGLQKELQFVFAVDAVNYCFWAGKDQPKWRVEAGSVETTSGGWFGLIACLERAIEEGLPILDAKYLLTISIDDCRKIFRAVEGAIPLLAERAASLQEAGGFLLARCNGQFINLIEDCEFDALKIVGELALLPFWRDISKMEGRDVVLLKRAQICAHDAGLVLRKHGKKIENTDMLTAFADYKLPQIMRMFGVMQYAPGLAKKIDAYIELLHDSREEIEIRASTIIAVERLKRLCDNMTAPEIDNVLWFLSQDIQEQSKPYHRTRTIFY